MNVKANYAKLIDLVLFTVATLAAAVLVMGICRPEMFDDLNVVAGVSFTVSVALLIYLHLNPDSVRARQSDTILKIARETLACFQEGFNMETAQKVCRLLLPATGAHAVAITDKEHILGYVGLEETPSTPGTPIRTKATHATLEDGRIRALHTPEEIGFPTKVKNLRAGIIVPLRRGDAIIGTLKFYYRHAGDITETQMALAEGLGELMSTQIAAVELEQQTKLATTMELKALQSQINPHFLFNTINTIASLVRTDPDRARMLLREFAVFYRRTLENSDDLVELMREIDQTMRYFTFEVARFGEDRLVMDVDIEPGLEDLMVPAFMVQPLVENAVRHAMPQEGTLSIAVTAQSDGNDVYIAVADNGIGMDVEQQRKLLSPSASKGLGIAMKNISERLTGYYGTESRMEVESTPGKGTRVQMYLKDALLDD
ncbi:MAG: histidine kinase [Slackia piriformis]|uniref:Histidine kinase n=1 Tax=Slackia piriformis TaxID=626934 RepID=A0A943URX6_9ACTN|nr:histidine kinase [Slackia piriformis]